MTGATVSMGPGAVPYNRDEALELSRSIRRRVAAALEPYMARAGEAQLAMHDDASVLEAIAERFHTDVDTIIGKVDIDRSIKMGAVVELMLDLQHACVEWDISVREAWSSATEQYAKQNLGLVRQLVYEVGPQKRPEGPTISVDVDMD